MEILQHQVREVRLTGIPNIFKAMGCVIIIMRDFVVGNNANICIYVMTVLVTTLSVNATTNKMGNQRINLVKVLVRTRISQIRQFNDNLQMP